MTPSERAALKRGYLDVPTRAGVYAIRNLANGRAMVGGSHDVQGALNRHRFELQRGAHRNAALRADWAAHGEASFVFEVLDRVKPRDEPGFDVTHELQGLVDLWRQEVACEGDRGYGPPPPIRSLR